MVAEGASQDVIFRSDSNGEDLEGCAPHRGCLSSPAPPHRVPPGSPTRASVACLSCCTIACWRARPANTARQTPSPSSTSSGRARSPHLSSPRSGRAQKCHCPHAVAGTGKVGVGWAQVCGGGSVRLGDGAPPGGSAGGPRRRPPPHQRLLPAGAQLVLVLCSQSHSTWFYLMSKRNSQLKMRSGEARRVQHLSVQSLELRPRK